ncbi:hypothetical protein BDQ17DRAFT_1386722 [Cyathus striatus]|nr:hypothetical protein BDQ17DRAFT_1386722 [Cyathus striatus]
MARKLRPRKSQHSYASMIVIDDEDTQAGPSSIAVIADEGSSGSEFEPEAKKKAGGEEVEEEEDEAEDEDGDGEEEEDELEDDELSNSPKPKRKRGSTAVSVVSASRAPSKSAKPKPKASSVKSLMDVRTPCTKCNHRHRAMPLYSRSGRVERLLSFPNMFLPNAGSKATDWVNKSWGYNVGWGPLWELVEDRGWYKEAKKREGDEDGMESCRRPRVYESVRMKDGWEILSKEDAALYVPSDVVTTEGNLKPAPSIRCFVGPIKSRTRLEINIFDTFHMSQYIPESNAHILSAGAPVWGIDWCPLHVSDRPARKYKQYLAIAPFTSSSHSPEIGVKVHRPSYACVQIWSLGPSKSMPNPKKEKQKQKEEDEEDKGVMRCEMILCLQGGPAFELKWCPLPAHDEPEDVTPEGHDPSQPVMSGPLIRIDLEDTSCWTFDWANSEVTAIGTTNDIIAVYNLSAALKSCTSSTPTITNLLPTYYLTIHQSAIRALTWIRASSSWPSGTPRTDDDPTVIASGGYGGVECMADIREGHGSVMNRTRDIINTMTFSPFTGGSITIDMRIRMLRRGHTLLEPQGPVWTVHASDYHPQLAVGSADGTCSTTDTLKSTRRGGSVPFFLHKIYQMDYSRNTKEFRMLERFLPQVHLLLLSPSPHSKTMKKETTGRPTATRAAKTKKPVPMPLAGTGAWQPEVGVHRVVWNTTSGLAGAGMLASATASGLCRVDVLWGRWMKGKIPYGGIEGIRREVDTMVVDTEGSESG